jgi:hypothetical protein
VENNMFNFGLIQHTTDPPHDDRVEVMVAQTRAWVEQSHAFDVLGCYETRLSRQLLKYTEEFERIQKDRIARERAERAEREADSRGKRHENKRDHFDLASFGRTAPEMVMSANSFRVLTQLPIDQARPPQPKCHPPVRFPEAAQVSCLENAGTDPPRRKGRRTGPQIFENLKFQGILTPTSDCWASA